jgi:alcohol dehydrogenase class IV
MVKEGCKRVCIVTDAGIRKAGLLEDGLASLKAAGVETMIFDGVVPDPLE